MKMMTKNNKVAVIIVAAGSSTRMGGNTKKEYLPLGEGTVLSQSVKNFLLSIDISYLIIAIPKSGEKEAREALYKDNSILELLSKVQLKFIEGGATRQQSVFNALLSLQESSPDYVLIHDGARPFVSEKIIKDTLEASVEYGASAPGIMPVDTQKRIDEEGFITEHLVRNNMFAIQTPQCFKYGELLKAHKKALDDNRDYTDDTEIWGKYVGKVKTVQGNSNNKKITYANDYRSQKETNMIDASSIRTGLGYDLHRLIEGRKLVIGGILFDFEKGEDGHSDGDALLHAITDALLGASGLGDIGSFFPPEEAKWKDADSIELLKTVWNKIKSEGWSLINLDCVVKLEKPKFLPKRREVIASIADALQVHEKQVFVKAKTGEKLDSVGSGNAIEAWATCLLCKNSSK